MAQIKKKYAGTKRDLDVSVHKYLKLASHVESVVVKHKKELFLKRKREHKQGI